MAFSMEHHLKGIAPYLKPDLVSPLAFSYIRALPQNLPSFRSSVIECRLGADQSQVDFAWKYTLQDLSQPENFPTHPIWQALEKFRREWIQPTSLLHQGVHLIWLEFDLDGLPNKMAIPSIFFCLSVQDAREALKIIEVTLRLFNQPMTSKLKANLSICADALPVGARINYFGLMLSRLNRGVRLGVERIIPQQQVFNYLAQIGWAAPTNALQSFVSSLPAELGNCAPVLAFDVGETVLPRLGLEYIMAHKQAVQAGRSKLFLDYLVEKGLCVPAKRNALLMWPGLTQETSEPESGVSYLNWCDRFLITRRISIFSRVISHIKIVYQPGSLLAAKGYIETNHHWVDGSDLQEAALQKAEANPKNQLSVSALTEY